MWMRHTRQYESTSHNRRIFGNRLFPDMWNRLKRKDGDGTRTATLTKPQIRNITQTVILSEWGNGPEDGSPRDPIIGPLVEYIRKKKNHLELSNEYYL